MIVTINGALMQAQQATVTLSKFTDIFFGAESGLLDVDAVLNPMWSTLAELVFGTDSGVIDTDALLKPLWTSLAESPVLIGAVTVALKSIITDKASKLFVDLGWISGTLGSWFNTALQSLILVEAFAVSIVTSIFKILLGALIKRSVNGILGMGRLMSGGVL